MAEKKLSVNQKFIRADQALQQQKVGDALKLLNEIIEEQPDYGRAHNHLAVIYFQAAKDFDRAEQSFKLALKYNPEFPPVYYNYGNYLTALQKFEQLNDLMEKALDVQGINKAHVYNQFGIMHELQGDYDKAIESYQEGIRFVFDDKALEQSSKSIERCKRKKGISG